ncbi:GntR family transcriptional regulator [Actinokineospora bangkokensis]|uniref:GntR family transcriptional regulator n=1 Tax=Actinokineospora bangkokensis TaxID=1193682 RepID=A0A1Q9LQQ0_9PSEU|nr:GntR family transcriptional regulator [Actinokineospora bangkokensis]OLR94359.1 GntR family transcriptional regulator [Actinokineospora bangkokensis]
MTSHEVRPARRRGLSDEVADRIRDGILGGAYPPGAALREVELAGVLQVSRGPVREALRALEGEGLVHVTWHRGATVTALSDQDVVELDSLRGALEELAVRAAAARATEADLDAVDRAAAAMARAADPHELAARDIAFHDAVFAAAHHGRLAAAWRAIRNQVHLFLLTRIARSADDYLTGVPAEHRALAAALRARDAATALPLFAAHRKQAFDVLTAGR